MKNHKVSIIVPVYNAENFLKKCINSILNQTERSFELILVNDGSKDKSGELCDNYARKDARVKVIYQKNSGVSVARNNGIKAASGEYIGFVDSDDWIEPDMFEKLIKEAEENDADIVMCDTTTVYSDGRTEADTITQLNDDKIIEKKEFFPGLLLEMAGSACRCIYKNSLIVTNEIAFPEGLKFSEDRIFNLYAMGQANKICYIKEAYYNRFVNTESAVHRFHADYFDACKLAASGTDNAIRIAWNDDKDYQTAYLSQFISGAFSAVANYYYKTSTLTSKERKNAVKALCDDKQLRRAIERYGADRKSQWILDRNYTMLSTYAKLANFKHGR